MKVKDEKITCNKCSFEWTISKTKLVRDVVKNENNKEMQITYFTCPRCNNIYVISILDDDLRALTKCYMKYMKLLKRSKEGTQEHLERYNMCKAKIKKVIDYELFLKNKYSEHLFLRNEKGENLK